MRGTMTDQINRDDRLDELREHGRQVLAKVRRAQQRALAAPVADTRTDAQIEAAYAAAMAEKRGARR